jgi:hypothetical protein
MARARRRFNQLRHSQPFSRLAHLAGQLLNKAAVCPPMEEEVQTSLSQKQLRNEAGVGLMEVIVGSLCALIVTFVLLQVGRIAYAKIKLKWATESLAGELASAKELAAARGQNVCVIFDAKRNRYGIDRNGNGSLDSNEAEDLPEEMSLSEDAAVTFTKAGHLAPKSKEPQIILSNARDSHHVKVNSAGVIDID